jgi:protein gp37
MGRRVVASNEYFDLPWKWSRKAAESGTRHKVFCLSMGDIFEQWDGPIHDIGGVRTTLSMDDLRFRVLNLIESTPDLDWLLLTKRPGEVLATLRRIADRWPFQESLGRWLRRWLGGEPPANVWLGVTVENQVAAKERTLELLEIPAVVRFVSYEPALEHMEWPWFQMPKQIVKPGSLPIEYLPVPQVSWVIVGGESGPHARPFNLAWARSTIWQCRDAGVACFVKQLGARPFDSFYRAEMIDQRIYLKHKAGADPSEWPEDLRVQEFPTTVGA